MSRDFKPFEQFLVDRRLGGKLRESEITFRDKNGKEVRIDNHIAKERYPELSFLFSKFDEFYKIVVKYGNGSNAAAVLDDIEECVQKAEKDFMKGQYDSEDETEEIVKEWFNRRLDKNFYYAEKNDRLFYEFIKEKIGLIREFERDEKTIDTDEEEIKREIEF